jgi:integrase
MARHTEPYTVTTRGGRKFWYYKLAGWSTYKSTGIRVKWSKSGEAINHRQAMEFARERWEESLAGAPDETTVSELCAPYFIWEDGEAPRCPHIARVLADKKEYTRQWAYWQRRRLEKHVMQDELGDIVARELTPGRIEDWKRRKLSEGVGARTLNMTLQALSTVFREEIHRDPHQFTVDPTATVSAVATESERQGYFTLEEVRTIFASRGPFGYSGRGVRFIPKNSREMLAQSAYTFHLAIFCTGERPSNILSWNWEDIEEDTVRIRRPKDRRKERTIPIARQLREALGELRELSVRIADDDPVFADEAGQRRTKTWYRKRFAHMMDDLELAAEDPEGNRRRPYSLKHSLITHLIDEGADPVLVREYVGHSHAHGEGRVLTAVQSRYKARQTERLRELVPAIEELLQTPAQVAQHD